MYDINVSTRCASMVYPDNTSICIDAIIGDTGIHVVMLLLVAINKWMKCSNNRIASMFTVAIIMVYLVYSILIFHTKNHAHIKLHAL